MHWQWHHISVFDNTFEPFISQSPKSNILSVYPVSLNYLVLFSSFFLYWPFFLSKIVLSFLYNLDFFCGCTDIDTTFLFDYTHIHTAQWYGKSFKAQIVTCPLDCIQLVKASSMLYCSSVYMQVYLSVCERFWVLIYYSCSARVFAVFFVCFKCIQVYQKFLKFTISCICVCVCVCVCVCLQCTCACVCVHVCDVWNLNHLQNMWVIMLILGKIRSKFKVIFFTIFGREYMPKCHHCYNCNSKEDKVVRVWREKRTTTPVVPGI